MDEPVQMIDRSSNILNVIADDRADDADKIASITGGFESDYTVWVADAIQYCYA